VDKQILIQDLPTLFNQQTPFFNSVWTTKGLKWNKKYITKLQDVKTEFINPRYVGNLLDWNIDEAAATSKPNIYMMSEVLICSKSTGGCLTNPGGCSAQITWIIKNKDPKIVFVELKGQHCQLFETCAQRRKPDPIIRLEVEKEASLGNSASSKYYLTN
jgi:hypothetical protein